MVGSTWMEKYDGQLDKETSLPAYLLDQDEGELRGKTQLPQNHPSSSTFKLTCNHFGRRLILLLLLFCLFLFHRLFGLQCGSRLRLHRSRFVRWRWCAFQLTGLHFWRRFCRCLGRGSRLWSMRGGSRCGGGGGGGSSRGHFASRARSGS